MDCSIKHPHTAMTIKKKMPTPVTLCNIDNTDVI